MERSDFLIALAAASGGLKEFLTDSTRRWLTNLIATGHDPDLGDEHAKEIDIDRIYEIMCYFTLIRELATRTSMTIRFGSGRFRYRLPYGPAEKRNFAFFRFVFADSTFDVCNGTAVPAKSSAGEPSEHPDIPLQRVSGSSAASEPGEPVALWDAKHHDGALTKPDIAQMFLWASLFVLRNTIGESVLEQLFPPTFQVSGIITNATSRPAYRHPLLMAGFSIVLEFVGPGSSSPPDPSRAEQLAFVPT